MVNDADPDVETVVESLRGGVGPARSIGQLEEWRLTTDAATEYIQDDPTPFLEIADDIVAAAYREAHREPARVEETTGKEQLSVEIRDNLTALLQQLSNEAPGELVEHRRRLVEIGLRADNQSQRWNNQHLFTNLAAHGEDVGIELFDSLLSTFTDTEAGDRRPVAGYYVRCLASDHETIAERGLPEVRELLREGPAPVRTEAVKFVRNLVNVGFLSDETPSEAALDATADVRPLLDADESEVEEAAVEALFEISEYAPERLRDDVEQLAGFIGHEQVSYSAATTIERVIEAEPQAAEDLPESIVSPFPDGPPTAQEHSLLVLAAVVETGLAGNEASALVDQVLPDVVESLDGGSDDVASEASELLSAVAAADPDALVPSAADIVAGLTTERAQLYTRRTLERLLAHDPATFETVIPECRRLLEADWTNRSTKGSVAELLSNVADQSPDRLVAHTDVLAAALDQGDDASNYACTALGEISREHPEAVVEHAPALLDVVDEENASGRYMAATALENVAEVAPDAVADGADRLLEMSFTASEGIDSTNARSACMTVLEERPDVAEDLRPEIRAALDSDDLETRTRAVQFTSSAVLRDAEPFYELRPRIEDALAADDERLTESAAECMSQFADNRPDSVVDAVPTLGETLREGTADVRKEAASALWHVATDHPEPVAGVVDDLVVAFRDSSDYTKDSICRVLSEVAGEMDAVPEGLFVELVEFDLAYSGSISTSNAVEAIGELSASLAGLDQAVRAELIQALRDGPTDRQKNAAAIARVLTGQSATNSMLSDNVVHESPPAGTEELLPALTDAFDADDEDVRKHAMWAVCGLSRTRPATVLPAVEEIDSLLDLESEANGQAMFPAAEALYHLAGHDAEALVTDETELVSHLVWLGATLERQSFDESPAGDCLGYTVYTTHGAKALGRVAQAAPDRVAAELSDDDGDSLVDLYEHAHEDVQEHLLGVLKEVSPGAPQIFGEGNEELAALFDSAPEAREDVAEIYCILAESNPDQVVESVPELTTALEARPGTQTEANLVTAIATIADSEPVDLRAYRDTFVELFAEGSLDLSGEVMLVDLLTRIPSTVDIELRPE